MDAKNGKKVPVLYKSREDCCGCFACCTVCPQSAIEMQADGEGFLYPHITAEKCIACLRCEAVCPIKQKQKAG